LKPIVADTHTHTLASGHAYGSIMDNVRAAAEKGLEFLCITDHGPAMYGASKESYFRNLHSVSDELLGVKVLKGAEVNILDFEGGLDLPVKILERLDWVIASYHTLRAPGTLEDHTQGWLAVAENPHVDVIGHPGDGRYIFETDKVIKKFKECGKIVEINSHSFVVRPGSSFNCREIARCCAKYQVPVVLSSDAHFSTDIGDVAASVRLLEEISFPEELILNIDRDRFLEVIRKKTGRF